MTAFAPETPVAGGPGPRDLTTARPVSAGRRFWVVAAVVVAGIVVINLLAQGIDRAAGGDQPGGAAGSSYATAPAGLAAFGSLLSHYGHSVQTQRGALSAEELPSGATAFVLDPTDLTDDDSAVLLGFVTNGGRLVVGGASPFYLANLRDDPPRWQADGDRSWSRIDPTLGDLREIDGAGLGSFAAPGTGHTLVGTDRFSLLTREAVGRGEMYFLADASPLENAYLATAGNAAFGLALAGDANRPVVFPEGVHGYGASRGWSAIPGRWKVALLLVALAALAFAWSRARRFGPPDQVARALAPARADYVRALSVTLERTRDRTGSLTSAQHWARARLIARAGLGPDAGDDALAGAARSFGCDTREIQALLTPVTDDESVLALGRAMARVGGNGRMQ